MTILIVYFPVLLSTPLPQMFPRIFIGQQARQSRACSRGICDSTLPPPERESGFHDDSLDGERGELDRLRPNAELINREM